MSYGWIIFTATLSSAGVAAIVALSISWLQGRRDAKAARTQAAQWLRRLNLQEHLWHLPPATFSGGEQQRVNIAHGMITAPPVLLLDEPTASLDADNRRVVVELIHAARAQGSAIVGIFHDDEVREAVATRCFDVEQHHKPV